MPYFPPCSSTSMHDEVIVEHPSAEFRRLQYAMVQSALVSTQVHACADEYKISGAHLTFNLPEEGDVLGDLGFLRRTGIQYHWANNGYSTFDDFLMDLKQSKRNNIRKVRSSANYCCGGHELARNVKDDLMQGRL